MTLSKVRRYQPEIYTILVIGFVCGFLAWATGLIGPSVEVRCGIAPSDMVISKLGSHRGMVTAVSRNCLNIWVRFDARSFETNSRLLGSDNPPTSNVFTTHVMRIYELDIVD